jgi:hypothetical protein
MKEAFNTLRSRSLPGAVVFAIALLIGPAMALANWEFTRWGMTVNEVERASRYSAIKSGQGSLLRCYSEPDCATCCHTTIAVQIG